ncbi:MAG: DUF1905 domain-containing protein [Spirochaetales bacterium]
MTLEFEGEAFGWRGPAPYLFVAMPEEASRQLKSMAATVTYGWGCIPVAGDIVPIRLRILGA